MINPSHPKYMDLSEPSLVPKWENEGARSQAGSDAKKKISTAGVRL